MKKTNLIYLALIYVLLLSMCSCSSRKVNINKSKEETKTELTDNSVTENKTESNVKTETKTTVDNKNETVTEETTYTPQDNTKESFVIEKDGTKVVLNNTKKTYKKTTQKNNTKTDASTYIDSVKKEDAKELKSIKQRYTHKKENKAKNVEKEAFNWFNLLWFLIPVLALYISYRIYKKLPLVPKF